MKRHLESKVKILVSVLLFAILFSGCVNNADVFENKIREGKYQEAIECYLGFQGDAVEEFKAARFLDSYMEECFNAYIEGEMDDEAFGAALMTVTKVADSLAVDVETREVVESEYATKLEAEEYYTEANRLLENGDVVGAAMAYGKCGDYKDAVNLSMGLWDDILVRNTISAGYSLSVALKNDGTIVYAAENIEDNYFDEDEWTDLVEVSAGVYHVVGLKKDGTVVTAGENGDNQCDVEDWTNIVAVRAGEYHTVGLKSDGTVVAVGDYRNGSSSVSGWSDIVSISAGDRFSLGLKSDGTVVACGFNIGDRCNVGMQEEWSNIEAISGYWCALGLKMDGTVVAYGDNDDGQCDVGDWTNITAISTNYNHSVGLRSDGTVVATGANEFGECNVAGWKDIVAVSAGRRHTLGLKADGTVVAVGRNYDEECEVGSWSDIRLPN